MIQYLIPNGMIYERTLCLFCLISIEYRSPLGVHSILRSMRNVMQAVISSSTERAACMVISGRTEMSRGIFFQINMMPLKQIEDWGSGAIVSR